MGTVRDVETRDDVKDWAVRARAIASHPSARPVLRQPDEVEYLSLEQYENLVRLAHWHMRRAGMTPVRPGMVTPLAREGDSKTVFVAGALLTLLTLAVLTLIRIVA